MGSLENFRHLLDLVSDTFSDKMVSGSNPAYLSAGMRGGRDHQRHCDNTVQMLRIDRVGIFKKMFENLPPRCTVQ